MATDNSANTPGRRLLPSAIDRLSDTDPRRIWASIPCSSNLADGFRDVSYKAFSNAINRAAWFLESTFGNANGFPTICYIGKSDIRYHIFSMAAAKTEYQVGGMASIICCFLLNFADTVLVPYQQPRRTFEPLGEM
jgi:hypothetical protein